MIGEVSYVEEAAGNLYGFSPTGPFPGGLLPDGTLAADALSHYSHYDTAEEHDVEFIVEGESLLADRQKLAQQCVFFSNMFRPAFRESIAKVIELKNVSVDSMRLFLKIISEEICNFNECSDVIKLLELFRLVDMFQHTPLIWAVSQTIQASIRPDNCCDVLRYTERYGVDVQEPAIHDNTMYTAAVRASLLAAANFRDITHSVTTLTLSLALMLLSRDDINVHSELETLEVALKWYNVHQHPDIFNAVRYQVISATDLLRYNRNTTICNTRRSCPQYSLRQRDALRSLYVIGGIDECGVEVYNIRTKDWSRGASLPEPRHAASVVSVSCVLYIIGGWVRGKHTNSVLQYTLRDNVWVKVESMDISRSGAGADVLDGRIFVCGGRNESRVFDCCESFEPSTGSWKFVANMNTPRTYHGLAATDRALYAVGGTSALDGSDISQLATVERYCNVSCAWSYVSPMGLPLMAPGCCSVGSTIYMFGGRNLSHSVISYSTAANSYNMEKPMAVPRGQGVQTVSVGKYIYCMGGCPGFGTLRSMERYDTATKTWSPLPSKGFAQRSTCFAVL